MSKNYLEFFLPAWFVKKCPRIHWFCCLFQLYLLADGQCIYRGAMGSLLPYLKSIHLECPLYNNPADYSKYLTPHQRHCVVVLEQDTFIIA